MSEEHPNAALVRRVFAAFGKDAMALSAAFSRDILWRVPGQTAMSGEYRGRRDVVEFLRRTGLETGGTYKSHLHTVFADDQWAVAIYRATGSRNGIDLDVEQALELAPVSKLLYGSDAARTPTPSSWPRDLARERPRPLRPPLTLGSERRDQRVGDDLQRPARELARPAEADERLLLGEALLLHQEPLRTLDHLPCGERVGE